MGDTDGALDWALTEAWVGNAGSIADDETSHAGALGSYADGLYDGQILRYDYSFGDFAAALSVEMDDAGVRDPGFAIGARYMFSFGGGSLNVGAGYQTGFAGAANTVGNTSVPIAAGADVEVIGLSAAVSLDSGLQAGIQYSMWTFNGIDDTTHLAVGAGYSFDAFTVSANYGVYMSDFAGIDDTSGYGLAAAYDFGGGLSAHLGYGMNDCTAFCDDGATWSLGLAMSF
jgi:outer membrane protein OmpU